MRSLECIPQGHSHCLNSTCKIVLQALALCAPHHHLPMAHNLMVSTELLRNLTFLHTDDLLVLRKSSDLYNRSKDLLLQDLHILIRAITTSPRLRQDHPQSQMGHLHLLRRWLPLRLLLVSATTDLNLL